VWREEGDWLAFWVVEEGRKGVVGAARLVKGLGGRQVGSSGRVQGLER